MKKILNRQELQSQIKVEKFLLEEKLKYWEALDYILIYDDADFTKFKEYLDGCGMQETDNGEWITEQDAIWFTWENAVIDLHKDFIDYVSK